MYVSVTNYICWNVQMFLGLGNEVAKANAPHWSTFPAITAVWGLFSVYWNSLIKLPPYPHKYLLVVRWHLYSQGKTSSYGSPSSETEGWVRWLQQKHFLTNTVQQKFVFGTPAGKSLLAWPISLSVTKPWKHVLACLSNCSVLWTFLQKLSCPR